MRAGNYRPSGDRQPETRAIVTRIRPVIRLGYGLLTGGAVCLALGLVLSLISRRDEVTLAAWWLAGPALVIEVERYVRPDRLAVVRGCLHLGVALLVLGLAMISVDGMVARTGR